ncbi:MAG: hypothetical protein Q7S00_00150 [bacterium]|nr:hypothetical protein [bacterium]
MAPVKFPKVKLIKTDPNQLGLFDGQVVGKVQKPNLREQAEKHILDHPEDWDLFRSLAYEMKKRKRKFGAKFIMEKMRWDFYLTARADEEFLVNNNFGSYWIRKLIKEDPGFKPCIELRKTKY